MPEDVIALITSDHREMERALELMKKDKSTRPLLLPLSLAMLAAHSRAEEQHVYPVVAKEAGEKDQAHHGIEEHLQAEELGRRLLPLDPESPDFDSALEEFAAAVLHHAHEEEQEILPALREAVDSERLTELGKAFAAKRAEELTGAGSGSHDRRSSGGNGGNGGKSKAELYEEARELGVEGRSAMDKEQLAEQVEQARRQT
ncbi:MAG: hemerythrin domain-containing protein [Streptosporangiaceae bacterium]|nr:hemerythrin domain-containing protein [Streptosporangiaceae bacterium]